MVKVIPKTVAVRIVVQGQHRWITSSGIRKPFDCDYFGAIKNGYGMSNRQAAEVVKNLIDASSKEDIASIVVFCEDPKAGLTQPTVKKATTKKKVKK